MDTIKIRIKRDKKGKKDSIEIVAPYKIVITDKKDDKSVLKATVKGLKRGFGKINLFGTQNSELFKISKEAEKNIENSWYMVGKAMNQALEGIINAKRD